MRALTVNPSKPNSIALTDAPPPSAEDGSLLVRALALGICGTDREIIAGDYGEPPDGEERLILGHESLGEVLEAPAGSGFKARDRVVGIVRRPDPVPCPACAAGEWDMCRNGLHTERGIRKRNGYGSEQFRVEPEFTIKIDKALGLNGVLMEPASILAKAWDQIDRIGRRSAAWQPRSVLVTGAGPIGFLAALMGKQRGLEVHILDRAERGPKPKLAQALGARYYAGPLGDLAPDLVIECTGAIPLLQDVMTRVAADGIVCLTGVSAPGKRTELDLGALNRKIVLTNEVVFGSVNANRHHYELAAAALAKADPAWLKGLITRIVPLSRWQEAFVNQPDDIKTVIDFAA